LFSGLQNKFTGCITCYLSSAQIFLQIAFFCSFMLFSYVRIRFKNSSKFIFKISKILTRSFGLKLLNYLVSSEIK
jgi:hypothetical protein